MALGLRTHRPLIQASSHLISAGHNLAAVAGYDMLESGGNATDAGVAAGLVLNVVLPKFTNFGGVAPILVYDNKKNEAKSITGLAIGLKQLLLNISILIIMELYPKVSCVQ